MRKLDLVGGVAEDRCYECDVVLCGVLHGILIVCDCNEGLEVSENCFIKCS